MKVKLAMTAQTNSAKSNIKSDAALSVIRAVMSVVEKDEASYYMSVKYFYDNEVTYDYVVLKQYVFAKPEVQKTRRELFLNQSPEYGKLVRQAATLTNDLKGTGDKGAKFESKRQVENRIKAINTRIHRALVTCFELRHNEHLAKGKANTVFLDTNKQIVQNGIKDDKGNVTVSVKSVTGQIKSAEKLVRAIAEDTGAKEKTSKGSSKAHAVTVESLEAMIAIVSAYNEKKSNMLDNQVIGAHFGGLVLAILDNIRWEVDTNTKEPKQIALSNAVSTDKLKAYADGYNAMLEEKKEGKAA